MKQVVIIKILMIQDLLLQLLIYNLMLVSINIDTTNLFLVYLLKSIKLKIKRYMYVEIEQEFLILKISIIDHLHDCYHNKQEGI